MADVYVKLEDVLALLPETDLVGPKPSRLKREILQLPQLSIIRVDVEENVE